MNEMTPTARVLIVDDVPNNIDVLASALGNGYEINVSTSGALALELVERQRPDLILLDVMMPGMNGFEVMERLKSSAATRAIPVIFVTARTDAESETAALAAGAADFIHKPINPSVVRARVRQQLELAEYRARLEAMVDARTRALAEARDRAEAACRAKSAFLSNMSHELRTPLHQVIGLTDLLARRIADETARRRLGIIKTSSQNLLGLVSGLLDIAQTEAQSLQLEPRDFDLSGLVEAALQPARQAAGLKGLAVEWVGELVGDSGAPAILNGDPRLLQKILEQLLSNAVKFSERGTITLRAEAVPDAHGKVALRFEVRDEGIGMPPDVQEGLFQLFNQGDNSQTRRFGGTGCGLMLCKRLLSLMGGELDYDTAPGRGTTFTVSLQLGVGNAAAFNDDLAREARTRQFLARMAELLARHDSDAMVLLDDHRGWLQAALGPAFEAFETAIYCLQFDAAAQLLPGVAAGLLPSGAGAGPA